MASNIYGSSLYDDFLKMLPKNAAAVEQYGDIDFEDLLNNLSKRILLSPREQQARATQQKKIYFYDLESISINIKNKKHLEKISRQYHIVFLAKSKQTKDKKFKILAGEIFSEKIEESDEVIINRHKKKNRTIKISEIDIVKVDDKKLQKMHFIAMTILADLSRQQLQYAKNREKLLKKNITRKTADRKICFKYKPRDKIDAQRKKIPFRSRAYAEEDIIALDREEDQRKIKKDYDRKKKEAARENWFTMRRKIYRRKEQKLEMRKEENLREDISKKYGNRKRGL